VKLSPAVDSGSLVRRLPALLLVVAIGGFVAWLVIRAGVVNALSRAQPRIAARIAPGDPRVAAGLVAEDLRIHMIRASPAAKREANRALLRAPLYDDPFLVAGIDRVLRRDYRGAEPLISHALARNPRARLTRLFRLDLELRAGRAEAAGSDMTILSRLLPEVQKVFVPELARLARDPQTRGPLRQALRSDPDMLNNVLNHLATHGTDPDVVLAFAGPSPPSPRSADAPDWRRALLDSMVAKGDLARAYRLWALYAHLPPGTQPGIYDGNFQGLAGTPPFNWNFASSQMGVAEPDKRGALQVEYYGRTPGELASQLLALGPGRYRLSFHAEGDLKTEQHRLIWRVQCEKSKAVILELPLANITYTGRNVATDFSVPPDCDGQWLRLMGEPTEFPKIENVAIRAMKIQRLGAAG
jgi:hypothetical protein